MGVNVDVTQRRGASRVIVAIAAPTVIIVSLTIVTSMLLFPAAWADGVVWILAGVATATFAGAGWIVAASVLFVRGRLIEQRKAALVEVSHNMTLVNILTGETIVPATALLPPTTTKPEPRQVVITGEFTDNTTGTLHRFGFDNLPAAALVELSRRVTGGASFAERTATRAGLSQSQFWELRDELIARRLAQWKHPNEPRQGVELTPAGIALLSEIAEKSV